jgi:ketosteroid isomerase-like protein
MATATQNGTAAKTDAEAWVEMFAEGWANPIDADHFSDHFVPHFHDDVRMIQPSMRPIVGKRAFREEFARPLFDLVPDLHGVVEGWATSDDVAYIELRLEGTVGSRPGGGVHGRGSFEMRTCDRIKLRDGKATERVAYLDATPLLKAVARSPRAWPKFLKSQIRNLRRPA